MIAPQGMVLITIPVNLPIQEGLVDQKKLYTTGFCSQLLETRLLRILRFQFGEVMKFLNQCLASPNFFCYLLYCQGDTSISTRTS